MSLPQNNRIKIMSFFCSSYTHRMNAIGFGFSQSSTPPALLQVGCDRRDGRDGARGGGRATRIAQKWSPGGTEAARGGREETPCDNLCGVDAHRWNCALRQNRALLESKRRQHRSQNEGNPSTKIGPVRAGSEAAQGCLLRKLPRHPRSVLTSRTINTI